MSNKITINGKTLKVPSGSIQINGNKITVNGTVIECEDLQAQVVNIIIFGPNSSIQSISDCSNVEVHGKVMDVQTVNGDVKVFGDIHGHVETVNGNVRGECFQGKCSTVNGNITGVKGE